MDCKKVESNLVGYFYKDLGKEDTGRIQDHLNSCESCQTLYQKMSAVLHAGSAITEIKPNDFLSTRIISKLENKKSLSPGIRVFQYLLRPAMVVSLVALGIFTGIKISNNYTENISANTEIYNNNTLSKQFASENFLTTPNDEYLEMYLNEKK